MKQAVLYKYDPVSEQESFLTVVDNDLSIGKSLSAGLTLSDWRCSGIHALIRTEKNGDATIIDLGSYFGTYVNREKIASKQIAEGDRLSIGGHEIVVRFPTEKVRSNRSAVSPIEEVSRQQSLLAEKKVNVDSAKELLEVSLFWGERLLEVRTFRKAQPITIGSKKGSTFCISSGELLDSDTFKLADYDGKILKLSVPQDTTGVAWIDDKTYALDTLRYYDVSHQGEEHLEISLKQGDRAHIEFGELVLSFKFVEAVEKIPQSFKFKMEPKVKQILGGLLAFYFLLALIVSLVTVEEKETSLDDIPEHLKKVVYDIGVKAATQKRQSAIGQIAKSIEGGRARAAEGKSKTRKSPKPKAAKKVVEKKKTKPKPSKQKMAEAPVQKAAPAKEVPKVDLDSSFAIDSESELVSKSAVQSENAEEGNTASALANGGFARGRTGLDAGGGGSSVGVGSLKGNLTGGGMGSGDYGLAPSKGRQIEIADEEEVKIMGGLDPDLIASIIKRYLPQIQHCYEQGLVKLPTLKGKVTVAFVITGQGTVSKPKIAESSLDHTGTEACIIGKVKGWKFPKPKGGGTVGVKYPFILMSNIGN